MKKSTVTMTWVALAVTLLTCATAAPGRQNPLLGSWQYDSTRSTFVGRAPFQRATMSFTALVTGMHVVSDVVVASGQNFHFEYRDPQDGSFVPVVGNPYYNSESTVWTDSHTATRTERRDGKTIGVTTLTVAADGATFTASARRTVPDGHLYTSVIVWVRVK